jgi:hypothetical protein
MQYNFQIYYLAAEGFSVEFQELSSPSLLSRTLKTMKWYALHQFPCRLLFHAHAFLASSFTGIAVL